MLAGYAFANVTASSTDAALVTGSSGRQIKIISMLFDCVGAPTDITFNSKGAGSGTAISATFSMSQNAAIAMQYNPHGWFLTNSGESLTCTTSSGSTVGVQIVYELILVPGSQ